MRLFSQLGLLVLGCGYCISSIHAHASKSFLPQPSQSPQAPAPAPAPAPDDTLPPISAQPAPEPEPEPALAKRDDYSNSQATVFVAQRENSLIYYGENFRALTRGIIRLRTSLVQRANRNVFMAIHDDRSKVMDDPGRQTQVIAKTSSSMDLFAIADWMHSLRLPQYVPTEIRRMRIHKNEVPKYGSSGVSVIQDIVPGNQTLLSERFPMDFGRFLKTNLKTTLNTVDIMQWLVEGIWRFEKGRVIYTDVKPENIVVKLHGQNELEMKFIDFDGILIKDPETGNPHSFFVESSPGYAGPGKNIYIDKPSSSSSSPPYERQ